MNASTSPGPHEQLGVRRHSLGTVDTFVDRDGVRIIRDRAICHAGSFPADQIDVVEFTEQAAGSNISWLLLAGLSSLTSIQAAMNFSLGLWALAGAIGAGAAIAWRRTSTAKLSNPL